jgi:hypothetical protein
MELAILFIALFMAVLIDLVYRPISIRNGWQKAADQFGLRYTGEKGFLGVPRPGKITGSYRARRVKVSVFVEEYQTDEGTDRDYFIDVSIRWKNPTGMKLRLQKRWHHSKMIKGSGIVLPDRSFSKAYCLSQSEPVVFGQQVFAEERLRTDFHATVGQRGTFILELKSKELHFRTLATSRFLPLNGMEWNAVRLKGLLDTLISVSEAAEAAAGGQETGEYLFSDPEVADNPQLGSPLFALVASNLTLDQYTIFDHGFTHRRASRVEPFCMGRDQDGLVNRKRHASELELYS